MAKKREAGRKKLRTREHVLAELGVNFVERQILACDFSVDRCESDYGLDLVMYTYAGSDIKDGLEIENGHVTFQVKATDKPKLVRGGKQLSFPVEVADVTRWADEIYPVILAVYDGSADRAHWLYVQRYLVANPSLPGARAKSVTLRIPSDSTLTPAAVRGFGLFRDRVLEQSKGVVRHDG